MDYSTQPPYQTMPGAGMPGAPMPGMPGQPATPPESGKRGKKKNEKAPTKRVVNRQFVIALIFAVVAALAIWFVTNGTAPASKFVVTAKGPIGTNTAVTANLLQAVPMPDNLVQPGSVSDADAATALKKAADALKNVRSQFPITANEQIIPEQFGIAVNLGTPLGADERLVSFRATVGATVAGSIKPGDRVDMYATAGDVAGPLVINVPVVSVTVSEERYNSVADQQSGGDKNARAADLLPGDPVPGTYVVRLKADQVGKVIAADATGKIYLAYRAANATDDAQSPTSAKDAICAGAGAGLTVCR